MYQIEIKNVSKSYKDTKALKNISLTFEENKIYGLLGRNGAGKSTLLNIISNRIFADEGGVFINGKLVKENDTALGQIYLMSEKNLYPDTMTIHEIFRWSNDFYPDFNMNYAYELCEKFGLNPKKKLKALSTGYNSIFKIIISLSVNTPFVFLDEPVLGLDANHRELFYRLLLENYAKEPRTFVISTHLIEEVSNLIEDIIIIKNGEIIKHSSTEELLDLGYTVSGNASIVDAYCTGKELLGEDILGGLKVAYCLGKVDRSYKDIDQLQITKLDLQKLFIELTND